MSRVVAFLATVPLVAWITRLLTHTAGQSGDTSGGGEDEVEDLKDKPDPVAGLRDALKQVRSDLAA